MERHPVPQNIMDVEFKLFGALTIRQFSYAAAGFVIALLFYFSELPDILKWMFIGISLLGGFFLSLVKINGQPSTVWMTNFITSMLEPQERIWRKTPSVPELLKNTPQMETKKIDEEAALLSREKQNVLSEMPLTQVIIPESEKRLIEDESTELKKIDEHFDFLFNELPQIATTSVNPAIQEQATPPVNPIVALPQTLAAAVGPEKHSGDTLYRGSDYAVTFNPLQKSVNRPIKVQKDNLPVTNETNYLKGLVIDKKEQPLAEADVFVSNQSGQVIRNTVSNSAGRFSINTALVSGDYLLDIRKEGLKFPRYSVSLKGDKILEIKLQAL
jgi:hypothetical protein